MPSASAQPFAQCPRLHRIAVQCKSTFGDSQAPWGSLFGTTLARRQSQANHRGSAEQPLFALTQPGYPSQIERVYLQGTCNTREVVARNTWALKHTNSLGKPDLLPAAARLALGLKTPHGL